MFVTVFHRTQRPAQTERFIDKQKTDFARNQQI